jgi:hypothetical protein
LSNGDLAGGWEKLNRQAGQRVTLRPENAGKAIKTAPPAVGEIAFAKDSFSFSLAVF